MPLLRIHTDAQRWPRYTLDAYGTPSMQSSYCESTKQC